MGKRATHSIPFNQMNFRHVHIETLKEIHFDLPSHVKREEGREKLLRRQVRKVALNQSELTPLGKVNTLPPNQMALHLFNN